MSTESGKKTDGVGLAAAPWKKPKTNIKAKTTVKSNQRQKDFKFLGARKRETWEGFCKGLLTILKTTTIGKRVTGTNP